MDPGMLPAGKRWYMVKVSARGEALTPKPVRLYADHVFCHHWASRGPGDHTEGYVSEGITSGPFGRWTAFVGSREACEKWLAQALKASSKAQAIRKRAGLK